MSYTDLILKDSPICVWSLSETSGTTANNEGFLTAAAYQGTYSSYITRVKVPMVFAGSQCIKLTSSTNYGVRVPSLNHMSSAGKKNVSSLEFWLKVSDSFDAEYKVMKKPNSETGIYIKNNFIVFRLGDSDYTYVSVQIDSWNKPHHIVASYTPSSISLTVDGVTATKSTDTQALLNKAYASSDEYFDFYQLSDGSTSVSTYIDSIALYPEVLDLSICKRHFVYGVGYDIPNIMMSANGGVMLDTTMSSTQPFFNAKYNTGYKLSNNLFNKTKNIIVDSSGKITLSSSKYAEIITSKDKNYLDMFSGSLLEFPEGTSLYIDNKDYAFSNGFIAKFDFDGMSWTLDTPELLVSIEEKNTDKDFIIYAEKTDTAEYKIRYESNNASGTNSGDIKVSSSAISGVTYLIVYELNNSLMIDFYSGATLTAVTTVVGNIDLPMIGTSVTFGAEYIDSNEDYLDTIAEAETTNRFTGGLYYIGSVNDPTSIPDTSEIETYLHENKITFNQIFKEVSYAGYGEGYLVFGTNEFGNPIGATRVEYSVPSSTNLSNIIVSVKVGGGSYSQILSGSPISGILGDAAGDAITFKIYLESEDLINENPSIDSFSLSSYVYSSSSVSIVQDNSSSTLNIVKTSSGTEIYLPELTKTPTMYYGNSTGLICNTSQYATLSFTDVSTNGTSNLATIAFSAKLATNDATTLITADSLSLSQDDDVVTVSGATLYVNGSVYNSSTNKPVDNEWNHYVLVLASPLDASTLASVTIGSSSGTPEFYLDNLAVFDSQLTSTQANKHYSLLYSDYNNRIDGLESLVDLDIFDSEGTVDGITYQLFPDQKSVSRSAALADPTESLDSLTTYPYTLQYEDNAFVDGVNVLNTTSVFLPSESYVAEPVISGLTFTFNQLEDVSGSLVYISLGDQYQDSFVDADTNEQEEVLSKVVATYEKSYDYVAEK